MKTPYDFYMPGLIDTDDSRFIQAARDLAPGLFDVVKPKTVGEIENDAATVEFNRAQADDKRKKQLAAEELASQIDPDEPLESVLKKTARVSAKYGQTDDAISAMTTLDTIEQRKNGKPFGNSKSGYFVYLPDGTVKQITAPQRGSDPGIQTMYDENGNAIGVPKTIEGINRAGQAGATTKILSEEELEARRETRKKRGYVNRAYSGAKDVPDDLITREPLATKTPTPDRIVAGGRRRQ